MTIAENLIQKATSYFDEIPELAGKVPPQMLVDFVIEKYAQHRNYPSSFSDEKINDDMSKHVSTMAMAVVDIFMKIGAEGQTSHSENGVSRSYENAYVSLSIFSDVLPFVKVIN